jgi:hypothetical protein
MTESGTPPADTPTDAPTSGARHGRLDDRLCKWLPMASAAIVGIAVLLMLIRKTVIPGSGPAESATGVLLGLLYWPYVVFLPFLSLGGATAAVWSVWKRGVGVGTASWRFTLSLVAFAVWYWSLQSGLVEMT